MSRTLRQAVASAGISLFSPPGLAYANDAGISIGGSPGLLSGHPTVRMVSELIHMDVFPRTVRTTADFVFVNGGAACRIRMGFPDRGEGADNPDEANGPDTMRRPARTTFTRFDSFVNGKPVGTALIRADQPGHYWHTKTVVFPAHSRVRVRDVYTQRVSGAVAEKGYLSNIGYIVHTGSSWHGTIGRTVLIVSFHEPGWPPKLTVEPATSTIRDRDWTRIPHGRIFYHGIGAPAVSGSTLRFERTEWRPTTADDLTLYFRP